MSVVRRIFITVFYLLGDMSESYLVLMSSKTMLPLNQYCDFYLMDIVNFITYCVSLLVSK